MAANFLYCDDCSVDIKRLREYHYRIKSEIWLKVAKSSEHLCVGCLEERLGRELCPDDFTNESINRRNQFKKSARLVNRLSKEIHQAKLERRTR